MNMSAWIKAGWLSACLLVSNGAAAYADDTVAIRESYNQVADLYGIPADLFYAIGLQESGRAANGSEERAPWPWTLNVAGAGYYFDTQTEAWDALRAHVEAGHSNIGVGLMQVTWPYNQYALVDIYSALDPDTNLRIGAQILRACYDRLGDWWKATGCYHSPGTSKIRVTRAASYVAQVRRRYREVERTS